MNPALAAAFAVAFAVVTVDEVRTKGHLPPYPQRYMTTGLLFAGLALLDAVGAPGPAAVLAWGLVLALAYQAVGASGAAASTAAADSTAGGATLGATVVAL